MKTKSLFVSLLLIAGTASAHIPVTESSTILDQNIDGSNFSGNYRVSDDCSGGLLRHPHSSGLAMVKLTNSFENTAGGATSKQADYSYTYFRRQDNSSKFQIKTGTMSLLQLKKITDVKKIDDKVLDSATKVRYEASEADVVGALSDDSADQPAPVQFLDNGQIRILGKECDGRVLLTPTTDTVP